MKFAMCVILLRGLRALQWCQEHDFDLMVTEIHDQVTKPKL